jgi:hypothetical protein
MGRVHSSTFRVDFNLWVEHAQYADDEWPPEEEVLGRPDVQAALEQGLRELRDLGDRNQ